MSLDEKRAGGNVPDPALPHVAPLAPPAAGIGLWWCALAASASQLQCCERWLSAAEHARAARFGRPELRDRYVIGRGSLRMVLGRALGIDPADVPIVRGARGRPQLAGAASLDFNISHTGAVALIGTLRDARIGVDVERIDRTINVAGIARRFLTERERLAIAPLDHDAARRAVLTLWTCKEAMSKATGDALSAPFASLDVDLDGGRALRDGPGEYEPRRWSLHAAAVPSDHVATVAVWRPS